MNSMIGCCALGIIILSSVSASDSGQHGQSTTYDALSDRKVEKTYARALIQHMDADVFTPLTNRLLKRNSRASVGERYLIFDKVRVHLAEFCELLQSQRNAERITQQDSLEAVLRRISKCSELQAEQYWLRLLRESHR